MNYKILKRILASTLAVLAMIFTAPVMQAANTYNDCFRDVSKNDWFYDSVAQAYSMGIINGVSATEYAPDEALDLASCIKLACCVHQLKTIGKITLTNGAGNWYDSYVSYAMTNNIITEAYQSYTVPASRAQIAVIFGRVLSSDDIPINSEVILKKPFGDVTDQALWYYSSVYKMYAYGIMTGDDKGNFNPESKIKRSEIAAVAVRMLDKDARVTVSLTDIPKPVDPSKDEPTTNAKKSMLLHKGGDTAIAFTGLPGFSILYSDGTATGYSADCINDVILSEKALTFRLKKNVGLAAMGIVRGWLNNGATSIDGVATSYPAEQINDVINERFSLYLNGRQAAIDVLSITTNNGDVVYTFSLTKACNLDKITDAVIICGVLSDDAKEEAELAIDAALATASNPFTTADSDGDTDGVTILFSHETDRLKVLYTVQDSEYLLRFIYSNGAVQTIATTRLSDIRINDAGTVLYYEIPAPDGSVIEYGISIGTPINNSTKDEKPNDGKDLTGVLSGLNITLSAKDKSLIALVQGEKEVLFRGEYSDHSVAFSVITIAPKEYYTLYPKYFETNKRNKILALKDGIYYALIFEDAADTRTEEAALRVTDSVVKENTFDIVYTDPGAIPDGGTYLYLESTGSSTIIGDPFRYIQDSSAKGGYRIENPEQTSEIYQVSSNCEVYVLAMDYAPCLKTTYQEFYKIWPLGSKWSEWRAILDPNTSTITKLIQIILP